MKNRTLRAILCAIAVSAAASAHAQTLVQSPLDDLHTIQLDIDDDGKPDHARLARNRTTNDLDLSIELGAGRPVFQKKAIASGLVLAFAAKGTTDGKRSLIVTTGCGGCSNDVSTTLTIVHRGGEFLVAGCRQTWDTRTGHGACDVDFLAGKATLSRNGSKPRPLSGHFASIKLADWSDATRPKGCE